MNASHESDLQNNCQEMEAKNLDDYRLEDYHHKLKQLPRQWDFVRSRVAYSRRRPVEFTVMSYNILAQNLLEDHSHLYTACNPRSLEWTHRRTLLMTEVAYHNPDIMNLQEVNKDHYHEYLKPRLEKLGYTGVYKKRTGDKSDGCATLWKEDKFHLLRFSPVEFCRGGLLDRDNIAIIFELQPVRSTKNYNHSGSSSSSGWRQDEEDKIVVANTHLLFSPCRGDIKLAQLMVLMAEIHKHAYLGPSPVAPSHGACADVPPATHGRYCPIIATGDFNMQPQSHLYKFLVGGRLGYEGLLVRKMAGQVEGHYGRNQLLKRNFFSPSYGVTDSCQYRSAVNERFMNERSCSSAGGASHNSGRVWHHLNLISVYRHRIEGQCQAPEVTSYIDKTGRTVDYVFYSVESREVHYRHGEVRLASIREGRLKLLARYGLISAQELHNVGGIPNDILPSDHLCLITKFLLT